MCKIIVVSEKALLREGIAKYLLACSTRGENPGAIPLCLPLIEYFQLMFVGLLYVIGRGVNLFQETSKEN